MYGLHNRIWILYSGCLIYVRVLFLAFALATLQPSHPVRPGPVRSAERGAPARGPVRGAEVAAGQGPARQEERRSGDGAAQGQGRALHSRKVGGRQQAGSAGRAALFRAPRELIKSA